MMRYLKAIQVLLLVGIYSLTVSTAYGDFNWPYGPPPDSKPPGDGDGPQPDKPPKGCPSKQSGSIIGCETQALGEAINVTGTPLSLHYQSDRVPGRRTTNILKTRLSGATLPPGLQRIHLEIAVAGQAFKKNFAPQSNLVDTFTWDGKDAYGRPVRGLQPVKVRIGYEYVAKYYTTFDSFAASFNRFGSFPIGSGGGSGGGAVVFSFLPARTTTPPIFLWRDYEASLGSLDSPDLGGWSLDVHHAYDAGGRTLYLGNGNQRSATAMHVVIATVAGTGVAGFAGDGGSATQAKLSPTGGIAVGSDGSLYISDRSNERIRRVGPDGVITTVAGTGGVGFTGDGGPATQATLHTPFDVAVGSDGSLYIADTNNHCIRRVGTDGIITTVAGTGVAGFAGDGGSATQAKLNQPLGVAVGPDGSLYIADINNGRIRRVGTDGIITSVAGTGVFIFGSAGDGGLATQAELNSPWDVTVGSDGGLYIAEFNGGHIRRVGTDGIITTVAGAANAGFATGDGGPATQAGLSNPKGVAVGADGSLYIADQSQRIRRVGPDGIITTVAGTGVGGFAGDGGPATQAQINSPQGGIAIGPNGSLYIADVNNNRIRQLRPPLPGFSVSGIVIAAEDGSEVYVFSDTGRHLRTLDALTGTVRFQFTYNAGGHLATITDGDGNVTAIERDGIGSPSAIVAPFGQRTVLAVQGGYLSRVTNPAGEAVQLTYNSGDAEGLLATLTDPRGNTHRYLYDALGRLVRDENPAGDVKSLARTDITDDHYAVAVTTALGLATTYEVDELPTGDTRRVRIDANGARTESLIRTDGSLRVTYPDGTVANLTEGPDPRFGMQAPILKSQTLTTPGGRTQVTTRTQSITLANPNDILSLSTLTGTLTIDGRTTTTHYDATTRKLTFRSPANRIGTVALDARSRVTRVQMIGLEPIAFGYTANGRVGTVMEGTGETARTTLMTYGGTGSNAAYLARIDDALERQTNFDYDSAGRASRQTLPGARMIDFDYDANGNLTSLTSPNRTTHTFAYTADQQLISYTSPVTAGGDGVISYSYDNSGRLTRVNQPDGQAVDIDYDPTGRPYRLTQAGRVIDVTYQGATANIRGLTGPAGQRLDYGFDGQMLISQTWSGPIAGVVSRTLDNSLRTATRTVGTAAISLNYDQDNLLIGVGDLTLTRHPDHGLVSGTMLGGVTDAWAYTSFGGLDRYIAYYNGTTLYDVQYNRDGLGRITAKIETIGGTTESFTYSYDDAGRLAEVKKNGAITHTYSYDANGNRLTANAVTATYDDQDRQTQAGTATFAYTLNGELQTKVEAGGTTSYAYDALGNLLNAALPGGTEVEYLYDGLSRRIGKKIGGTPKQGWLYDERNRIVAELDGTDALVSRFVYASHRNVPDYMIRSGAKYRLVSDHLGTVRFVVKADDGSIAQRLEYDPFGRVTNDTAPGFQPFGFAGGLFDQDTRLVRFGARDYDSVTGRWVTKDPILFAGGDTNLYAYASNDPINHHDSNGLDDSGDGGVCLWPPPDLNLGKPLLPAPNPLPPTPPLCPTCSVPPSPGGGSGEEGPSLDPFKFSIGPFTFKGGLNRPANLGGLRDWNPRSLFDKWDLKLDAPLNPDFTLPDHPKSPGSPDPNGPNPKPQGPQCQQPLDTPNPAGCEN
jgi:RHS repeat-associated protein